MQSPVAINLIQYPVTQSGWKVMNHNDTR